MVGGIASSLSAKLLIGRPVLGFLLVMGRAVGFEVIVVGRVAVLGVSVEKIVKR
jgi:hypothetical protein